MIRFSTTGRALRRGLTAFGVVALLASACSDDTSDDDGALSSSVSESSSSTTTTEPATTAPIPETGQALGDLQLSVVQFGDDGYVEIVNSGSDPITLAGVYICEFPDYADLGDVAEVDTLDPGATTQIAASVLGGLSIDSGEAALYDGDDFDSADAMLSYVQWGSGDHQRASVAAEAGLWPSVDDFVTPDPAFGSIESGGFAPDPESWS